MFNSSLSFRIIVLFVLLVGMIGITPVQANAEIAGGMPIGSPAKDNCVPNSGWMWKNGPL
jgi:hypothetical protein